MEVQERFARTWNFRKLWSSLETHWSLSILTANFPVVGYTATLLLFLLPPHFQESFCYIQGEKYHNPFFLLHPSFVRENATSVYSNQLIIKQPLSRLPFRQLNPLFLPLLFIQCQLHTYVGVTLVHFICIENDIGYNHLLHLQRIT